MRINTRLAVAVHMLTLVALNNLRGISNTSEHLALSVNTHPVVMRRMMSMLKKAGLVEVKPGVGGAYLKRSPSDITWLDIFNAVKPEEEFLLFNQHESPNPNCYVGAYIHDALEPPLLMAQKAMEDKLSTFTLLDAMIPIAEKNNMKLESSLWGDVLGEEIL